MSTKKRDYYQVMGIQKTATQQQIKKAYKKLAIKWHPDKNLDNKQQATKKFREIAEAYEILSDQNKRKQYDTYGHDGPKFSSANFGNFNFHDADWVFKDFFSHNHFDDLDDDDFFAGFFGRKGKKSGSKSKGGFGSFGSMGGMGGMGGMGFKSMFDDDDFFSKGFNEGGHFSSFSSSSFGNGPGLQKSVSTTTKTVNGKTVTTKKTTVVNPDGTKDVTQQVVQNGNKVTKKYSLGNGGQEFKSVKN